MERAQELIQKYLDGIASPAEVAELETLVRVRPDVADAFAAATRLDSFLGQRLGETRGVAELRALLATAETPARPAAPLPPPAAPQVPRRGIPWVGLALAAGVLLAVTAVSYVFFRDRDAPGPRVLAGRVLVNGTESNQLPAEARVQVVGDQKAVLRLEDGSRMELTPSSAAVLHGRSGGQRERVELLSGDARFEVKPGEGPFQIDTAVAGVTVVGTSFALDLQIPERVRRERLRVRPDWKLTVSVTQGRVQVRQGDRTTDVAAGQSQVFVKENFGDLIGRIEAMREGRRLDLQVLSPRPRIPRTVRLAEDVLLVNTDQLEVGQTVVLWMAPELPDTAYLVYLQSPAPKN